MSNPKMLETENWSASLLKSQPRWSGRIQLSSRASRSPSPARMRPRSSVENAFRVRPSGPAPSTAWTALRMTCSSDAVSSPPLAGRSMKPSSWNRELAGARRVRQRQRVEAGGLARHKDLVLAAHGADEDLGAAILVDEQQLWARLHTLRLRRDEGEEDGLATAGRADDGEIAEVADVVVVIIGGLRRRLENRDRRPPVVSVGPAARIIVQRSKAGEVLGGDDRLPRNIGRSSRAAGPRSVIRRGILTPM